MLTRLAFALAVLVALVTLLRAGHPLALLFLPLAAIAVRRWSERGGLRRAAARLRHP